MDLIFVKNHLSKTAGQHSREIEKADEWSDGNHWHEPDQFPRLEVGIDKVSAQSSLSVFHCQSQRFSDCVLCLGKKGNNPVESWKKQIQ